MNTQFIKFLRLIGVAAMATSAIFLLYGVYTHSIFDGADLLAIALIGAGASTFALKERDRSMYVSNVERYW